MLKYIYVNCFLLERDFDMPDKNPESFQLITYAWVIGLSILGGIVSFFQKVKKGQTRIFNIVEFIGEVVTSAFVGIVTFYLCQASHMDELTTAGIVAISGHMGSRALFLLERYIERYADIKIPK